MFVWPLQLPGGPEPAFSPRPPCPVIMHRHRSRTPHQHFRGNYSGGPHGHARSQFSEPTHQQRNRRVPPRGVLKPISLTGCGGSAGPGGPFRDFRTRIRRDSESLPMGHAGRATDHRECRAGRRASHGVWAADHSWTLHRRPSSSAGSGRLLSPAALREPSTEGAWAGNLLSLQCPHLSSENRWSFSQYLLVPSPCQALFRDLGDGAGNKSDLKPNSFLWDTSLALKGPWKSVNTAEKTGAQGS